MVNIIKMSAEGKFVFNYGAPVLIILASKPSYANNFADVSCAMQNMMLACNELELGSCWVNQIRHLQDNERIQAKMRELGLGEDEKFTLAWLSAIQICQTALTAVKSSQKATK